VELLAPAFLLWLLACTLLRKQLKKIDELTKEKKDANYYAMTSQISPHFMFNSLENIRMRIETESYAEADDMLFNLGNFLRYHISMRRESSLFDELKHIRHYMEIYRYRRNDLVSFSIELAEDVGDISCPFCILQPIVENCFKHGISELGRTLQILVEVKNQNNGVEVCISDNGPGIDIDKMAEINKSLQKGLDGEASGLGLWNVNSRLKYFYGEKYGLSLRKSPKNGLCCVLFISDQRI